MGRGYKIPGDAKFPMTPVICLALFHIRYRQVNHSQRMGEKHLRPWIEAELSGKIVAGHCNCVAGLGESCSHVASLLWVIEAGVRIRDSLTVIQKKAYWVMPPAVKEVAYSLIHSINFQGKKAAHKSHCSPCGQTKVSSKAAIKQANVICQSSDKKDDFFGFICIVVKSCYSCFGERSSLSVYSESRFTRISIASSCSNFIALIIEQNPFHNC